MCLQSLMKIHHWLFKILRKNQNFVDEELQRAITLTELAPSPYFSIINVHLVDINVFAKFDEIPSLPVQVIKEKPKCCRLRITKGKYSSVFRENRCPPPPKPFYGGNFSHEAVTLKIRSRSPKSNKLLILSDLYRLANLATFHPMVHEITCRQTLFGLILVD